MKRFKVTCASPDVVFALRPSSIVDMPDTIDVNDPADRVLVIQQARIDLPHEVLRFVDEFGMLPNLVYAIEELPIGVRKREPIVVLKRGVPA